MTRKLTIFTAIIVLLTAFSLIPVCSRIQHAKHSALALPDLDGIRKRGRLIAVTDFNSVNYFIYKGEPMGFNYELLKSFSEYLEIDLEIIAENNPEYAIELVSSGKADLLACGIADDESERQRIRFTEPVDETGQVLVRRKPESCKMGPGDLPGENLTKSLQEMEGRFVYAQSKSSPAASIERIRKQTGTGFKIVTVPFESETLIRLVAKGEIDYAVCNENIAAVNATYYPNIDISIPVAAKAGLPWGVRADNSEVLLAEMNRWISSYRKTASYALLHSRYFNNSLSRTIVNSDYYPIYSGRVSRYDDLIRKFSNDIGWDWRLLAALICQESQFRPDVISGRGAYGLMQIMPITARNFGIDITTSPENNIRAGILYIGWLNSIFESRIPDDKERLNFILASYNAGPGHILDAMRLAFKNGRDPLKWDGNVAIWLLKKSEPQYFNDSVVKNGYFRGTESVKFVTEVLTRFEHYRNIIPEEVPLPF